MARILSSFVAAACAVASVAASHPKKIMHFSDVHLNLSATLNTVESEKFPIEYADDAPISLLTSALQYAKQVLPSPEFFLYTGDHAVHDITDSNYLASVVETNVKTLEKYYSPKDSHMLETTALVGNADTTPDYSMNVTDGSAPNSALSLIAGAWKDSLSSSDVSSFVRKGYLKYNLDDDLVVITLNTIPYSPSHTPDTSSMPDPFGQFAWLQSVLTALKAQRKYAYIIGHIPPMIDSYSGAQMWEAAYITTYKSIVGKFSSVIKAQIFGHVHSIEFRVPLNEDQNTTSGFELVPLFTTAAISPIYKNNPAFMIWDYHPETYELLDYTVYGTNITGTNSSSLAWKPLFKASEAYGVSSLTTSELNKFIARAANNASLLQQYYYNSKALSYLQSSCLSSTCQAKWMCTLKWWSTSADYAACVTSAEATNTTTVVTMSAVSAAASAASSTSEVVVGVAVAGAVGVAAIAVLVVVRQFRKGQSASASLEAADSVNSPNFDSLA